MNCKIAEIYIMRYAEKKLKPEHAKELAEHLIVCRDCRESFVIFDTCIDNCIETFDESDETVLAPVGFTAGVMARVRESKESRESKEYAGLWWGVCSVVCGLILLVVFNTQPESSFIISFIEAIVSVAASARPVIENVSASLGGAENFGVFTFAFVTFLSVLLYVLHNSEKRVEA